MTNEQKRIPIIAPTKKGVDLWVYDPAKQGHDHARGHKKYQPLVQLHPYQSGDGYMGIERDVMLDYEDCADGYVVDTPTEPTFFRPGEVIGYFVPGYVYHYQWYGEKQRRLARRWAHICYKHPRVYFGQHTLISGGVASAAWWVILAKGWTMGGALVLIALIATFWAAVSGTLLKWGTEAVNDWLEVNGEKYVFGENQVARRVRRCILAAAGFLYLLIGTTWLLDPDAGWFSSVFAMFGCVLVATFFFEGALYSNKDDRRFQKWVIGKVRNGIDRVFGTSDRDDSETKEVTAS